MRAIILKYNIYIMKTTYGFFKLLTYSSICTPIISCNRKINSCYRFSYLAVYIHLCISACITLLSRIVKAYLRCQTVKVHTVISYPCITFHSTNVFAIINYMAGLCIKLFCFYFACIMYFNCLLLNVHNSTQ